MINLSGSNYLCLEHISMVLKMFEPLKFDYAYLETSGLSDSYRCQNYLYKISDLMFAAAFDFKVYKLCMFALEYVQNAQIQIHPTHAQERLQLSVSHMCVNVIMDYYPAGTQR